MKILVFYDGWCPICVKVKRNIEKLDWLHVIELKNIREDLSGLHIPVTLEELEKKMYCLNINNGQFTSGIDAVSSIVSRLPVLMILWVPIKLSSILGFGHTIYNNIARSRIIIPVNNCTQDTCELEFPKK